MSDWKKILATVLLVTQLLAIIFYLWTYYHYWKGIDGLLVPKWWAFEVAGHYVAASIALAVFGLWPSFFTSLKNSG